MPYLAPGCSVVLTFKSFLPSTRQEAPLSKDLVKANRLKRKHEKRQRKLAAKRKRVRSGATATSPAATGKDNHQVPSTARGGAPSSEHSQAAMPNREELVPCMKKAVEVCDCCSMSTLPPSFV